MPKSKYKRQYAEELVEYFKRFLEMRDDPEGNVKVLKPPCSGYQSLVKFAIRIGVTPQTLNNWRDKHEEFMEAMEFADMIQDEVLNERALAGSVDGRVAMKIRELKINARKASEDEIGLGGLKIEIKNYSEGKIELKEYEGEVNEDTGYTEEH